MIQHFRNTSIATTVSVNTAASKLFEGNLKEFLLFFEGNLGQKKEKIRNFPILEMEALSSLILWPAVDVVTTEADNNTF